MRYDVQERGSEDSFGMVGAILEIIVMSGLDKVVEFRVDKAKPFFKRFGIGWHDTFKADMRTLANAAKRAKEGKGLAAKLGFKSNADDVVPGGGAKVADDAIKGADDAVKNADDALKNTKRNVKGKLDNQVSRSSVEKELRQAYIQRQDEVARTMGKKPQYMKMEKWQKRNADFIDTTVNQRKMDLLDTMIKGKRNEVESLFPKETIEKMDNLLSQSTKNFEKKLDMVLEASSKNPKQLKNELDYLKAAGEIKVLESLKGKAAVRNHNIASLRNGKLQGKAITSTKKFVKNKVADLAISASSTQGNLNSAVTKTSIIAGVTRNIKNAQSKFVTLWNNVAAAVKANILAEESGNSKKSGISKVSGINIYRQAKAVVHSCPLPFAKNTIPSAGRCGDRGFRRAYNIVDMREKDKAVCSSDVNFGIFGGGNQRDHCVDKHIRNMGVRKVSGWEYALLSGVQKHNALTLLEVDERATETSRSFEKVDGECNGNDATQVFQGMDRKVDDFYTFDCNKSPRFCECLIWVGDNDDKTVVFREGEEKLELNARSGNVIFEYCRPEGCGKESSRRRLLQGGGTGNC